MRDDESYLERRMWIDHAHVEVDRAPGPPSRTSWLRRVLRWLGVNRA